MTHPGSSGDDGPKQDRLRDSEFAESLRTPRAAAVAGVGFAVLAFFAFVCLHLAVPVGSLDNTSFDLTSQSVALARIGSAAVPFAGICFLWFIGVIRTHIGAREDRLFATVFLGSGLIFVAMLFVSTAVAAAVIFLYDSGISAQQGLLLFGGRLWDELLSSYAARMAGAFTLAATTLGRRTGVMPPWLQVVGYLAGLAMMVAPFGVHYVELLFPLWVAIYSVYVFATSGASEVAGVSPPR